MENAELQSRALALLAKFYGYRSFRPGQLEIIQAVSSGRDAVVLMPTGGGKSLCFQLPALLASEGFAVVVSPLIALMQDQTQALRANGVPAAALHSNQSEADNRAILQALGEGKIKLLYTSPERLMTMLDWLATCKVSLYAIDEAHCISQWGHDFRPEYTQLSKIKQLQPNVPVVALTATADRVTREDIAAQLGLIDPYIHIGSFDRPNISLKVYPNPGPRGRVNYVRTLVQKYPQDSGIVYCLSRANTENMTRALQAAGLRVVTYHAGMSAQQRNASLHAFLSGEAQVVCATVAFGMGIDKSNIRWIVHNNMPGNIESYYQEVGRAGRDGLPAEAVLFYSYADVVARSNFASDSGMPALNLEKLERMKEYAEARVCRRRILLSYFSEERNCDCGNCDVCLNPPDRFDGTILAQKALSACARTDQKIGINTLVCILRGMRPAEIVHAGYHLIKTFGAGADLSYVQWVAYITQMIQLGLFEVAYNESNHLRITAKGMRVLRGENIELARYMPPAAASRKKGRVEPEPVYVDPRIQLFEQLKAVRASVAKAEGIPPEIIFNDPTLLDMATRKPRSLEEFLQVSGVGERKGVRYGRRFIAAIRKFEGLSGAPENGTSLKETLILFNARVPLPEIASIKKVKLSTIQGHIAELIEKELITDYRGLVSRADYERTAAEYHRDPEHVYANLKEQMDPGILRIALAICKVAKG